MPIVCNVNDLDQGNRIASPGFANSSWRWISFGAAGEPHQVAAGDHAVRMGVFRSIQIQIRELNGIQDLRSATNPPARPEKSSSRGEKFLVRRRDSSVSTRKILETREEIPCSRRKVSASRQDIPGSTGYFSARSQRSNSTVSKRVDPTSTVRSLAPPMTNLRWPIPSPGRSR